MPETEIKPLPETEIKPLPVSETARGFAELCFAGAKTTFAETVLRGVAKLQREGANIVERGLPLLAYVAGAGSADEMIAAAQDLRTDPEISEVLMAFMPGRLRREGDLYHSFGLPVEDCLPPRIANYQCAVIIWRLQGGGCTSKVDLAFKLDVTIYRRNLEALLKRRLTGEERTAFGEQPVEKTA